MSRGNHKWVVLHRGERVAVQCPTVAITSRYPEPIMQMLQQYADVDAGGDVGRFLRMVALEYLEQRYRKEHANVEKRKAG